MTHFSATDEFTIAHFAGIPRIRLDAYSMLADFRANYDAAEDKEHREEFQGDDVPCKHARVSPVDLKPKTSGLIEMLRSFLSLFLFLACVGLASAQDIGDLLGGPQSAESEQQPSKTIDTQNTPAIDAQIAERLRGIFAELDELDGIAVSVSNGVVTLDGTAGSAAASDRAKEMAQMIVDVVEVVDETSIDNSLERRFDASLSRWESNLRSAVMALPTFVVALLMFGGFWWLGRRVSARRSWFLKITPNGFIANLVAGASRILVTLIGLVLALSLLDATSIIGTVLGAAGIIGLAVGFAVRDTVENYIASILLSLRQPFNARDLVAINGNEGRVARLSSRATILITLEGNHVRIPNSEVYKATIINYTRNPQRRFQFTVGVDTDLALKPAQDLAIETVQNVPGVLTDPPAQALIDELGDSNVSLKILCWVDQRTSDWYKVRSEAIRSVKHAFDEAGIVMPEPIYRLKIATGSTTLKTEKPGTNAHSDAKSADEVTVQSIAQAPAAKTSRNDDLAPGGGTVRLSGALGGIADTSNDTSVEATLEEEIQTDTEENLLAPSTNRQ